MSATGFVRVTGATFGGSTVDGITGFSWSVVGGERTQRSDGALGETAGDRISETLSGTLISNDEDAGAAALLMTGAVDVLVVTGVLTGGTVVTITIGVTADSSGVVFTGFDRTVDNTPGRVPTMTLTWEGVYHADHTATIGDGTAFTAGTCLMKIISS